MRADVVAVDDGDAVPASSQEPEAVANGVWMRCCAQCQRVLLKSSPHEPVRCDCGWEWPA